MPAALGADGSNGPNSSTGPSLHVPSAKVPPQPCLHPHIQLHTRVRVTCLLELALRWWGHPSNHASGSRLCPVTRRQLVSSDASLVGWGAWNKGRGIWGRWRNWWATHCSLFFPLGRDIPPLSKDAMSHQWPQGLLYAFPPFDFFLPLLQRIRIEEVRLVLIPPKWPHMVWLSDIPPLICGAPWELPVSKDLLSQAHRVLFHNSPQGPNQAFLPKILSDSQFNQRLELYP